MPDGATGTPDEVRRLVIESIAGRRSGHLCSSLSVLDILFAVYAETSDMGANPGSEPGQLDVVLSKGHAAPALYAVLQHFGLASDFGPQTLRRIDSPYEGHPRKASLPAVPCSTGSLGLGLGFAVGRALAYGRTRSSRRVVAVCSDGEMQTGIAYESLRTAARTPQVQLTVIVDWNGFQCSGPVPDGDRLPRLFDALDIPVQTVDGHDVAALRQSVRAASVARTTVVLARTVPCRGLAGLEGRGEVYGEQLTAATLKGELP